MLKNNDIVDLSEKENNFLDERKTHPWRICPIGKHLVRTHQEHIPPSKTHPDGTVTTRHEHCAENPSRKDLLTALEIQAISGKHFSNLSGPPAAHVLTEYPKADNYDVLIRGWVSYWNDIFNFKEPLDPNVVKALMATESSFDANAENIRKKAHARGLLQIMESTRIILSDHKGELPNNLIQATAHDLFNPSINICCGVRWLFRKKVTATSNLGHEATWEETVIEYKAYWNDIHAGKTPPALTKFRDFYNRLTKK